jgi:Trk K+ transport system NAD-binding subunit
MSTDCTPASIPASLRHVVVAGFGPVGRCVTEQLLGGGVEVTIIDLNPRTIETQHALGLRAILGDVSDPAVLKAAGIERADALILTVPNEDAAVRACAAARGLAPKVFIAARTNFVSRGLLAAKAGADHVTIEELVTAEAMRDAVVRHFFSAGGATE